MIPPLGISEPLEEEYLRWRKELGEVDQYTGNLTIGIVDVLKAHFMLIDYFYEIQEGIGGIGPKSIDLLHSALSRQFVGYGTVSKWQTIYEISATLFFGIIKNHPFHDANKRTAFLTSLYYLQTHNRQPNVPQKEFEDLTVHVANNSLKRYKRFNNFSEEEDCEVKFIADFFKRKTRQIDKRFYVVTYRQLNTILGRYGCELANPQGNHIDIVCTSKRRKYLGFGPEIEEQHRVGQIGFPSWKTQVGKGAIKTVRQVTGLTHEKGVDSKSFFHGYEPLDALVDEYRGPLRRLADK